MTNCIICHKEIISIPLVRPIEFVLICFDCIKKQNKN